MTASPSNGDLLVTQIRSTICTKPKHRGTMRALGLRGVGRSRIVPDRPEIRGMLARVPHLVTVEAASPDATAAQLLRTQATRGARRAAEGRKTS
jgi:large subunit ribosomal protein L30